MFHKILIANRGEIAVRIIRAAREMGIKTVAIYSKEDKEALHTLLADEAVCVGPSNAKESYLNMENIINSTVLTGCEAIHPGFGFLSENSKFAAMCKECNIKFIGPNVKVMNIMGDKNKAKKIAEEVGLPVIPGSKDIINTLEEAISIGDKIGYPVMLKASNGGGGKGIRLINNKEDMNKVFNLAKAEAESSFGDGSMYIERFIEKPRHIEIQILGDSKGNVIYFPERDCSIQRKNQKIIEETPSKIVNNKLREQMGKVAVTLAKKINYEGAGTVEFLLDKKGNFYFMEMNTRIQVEHGITELVTGIDLIKQQIKIASGEVIDIKQENVRVLGHAIECRINAENPLKNFMPCAGTINNIIFPGGFGVRIDTSVYNGYKISPYYDSMIAKLIVFSKDRNEAINKMKIALEDFIVEGIETNIEYNLSIINNEDFIKGEFNTSFIESHKL